ncbi:MAG: glycosyltransferase [Methylophilaceae bacterium]
MSSTYPTIAVCLAAYNGTRYLDEQLNSIFAQTCVNVTVFVSVDVSIDGTEAFIDALALKDSRIVVLPHGEYFGGASRNFFRLIRDVDFSSFDYVSLADQDDIWLPNKLLSAHEVLVNNNAAACSSDVLAFWPDGRRELIKKSQPQVKWDFLYEAAGPGCTYVLSNDLASHLKQLITKNWEEVQKVELHDWFIYAFARVGDYGWVIDDVPNMLYRQHDKNQVGVNHGYKAGIARFKKIMNGWLFDQSTLIAKLVGFEDDSFKFNWLKPHNKGIFWLALQAGQCRRRLKDKIAFALSCLILFVLKLGS